MLVDYSESDLSDESNGGDQMVCVAGNTPQVPQLPAPFQPKLPNDNPAQHQGRTRSKPFIEGAYSAHVFLSVPFEYKLQKILSEIYQHFTYKYKSLHSLFPNDPDVENDCYISLSRPLSLRYHQLKKFNSDVGSVSKHHRPITISFSHLTVLYNDNKTRAFVVIPVVAGYSDLKRLVDELDDGPIDAHHQEKYYDPPIFHTSIGWLLTVDNFDGSALTCSVVNVKIAKNVHSYELSGLRQFKRGLNIFTSLEHKMSVSVPAPKDFNAETAGNLDDLEKQFAVAAVEHSDVYWNLITKIKPSLLKLTPIDDEILASFYESFPELQGDNIIKLNEDDMKSAKGKERWRNWIMQFEKKVDFYNFGCLLRADARGEYSEHNTMFVTRMHFYAVEIARNRLGINDKIWEKAQGK
ncbi:hypothetical protein E3P98_02217 [Wallemia ichthyophaga]|nr:hypothetical protein E3P98_02217 [Wallemia ichthyophaga]